MSLKKSGFFIFIILSIFTINGLAHSIYSLWQKQQLLVEAQNELTLQEKENASFKQQLTVVQSKQFVEEEARNKLFLDKPGEGVIVMPQPTLQASPSSQSIASDNLPNWEKWWDVFF